MDRLHKYRTFTLESGVCVLCETRQLNLRRKSESSTNQRVGGSNPWIRKLHVEVYSGETLDPKLLLLSRS